MSRRRTEDDIIDEVAWHFGDSIRETVETTRQFIHANGGPDMTSPIERIMYTALVMSPEWYFPGKLEHAMPAVSYGEFVDHEDLTKLACPAVVGFQYPIGKYRADFILKTLDARVAIECDGHDFHERTKEQAQRDKARDRFFQAEGWPVLRFTGSEIWADPVSCANEAVRFVIQAGYAVRK